MSNIKLKDLLQEMISSPKSRWSQMTPKMRADFLANKDKVAADRKAWLSSKIKNPETGNMISVKTALSYKYDSPVYIAAIKASEKFGKASMRYDDYFDKKGNPKQKSTPVKGQNIFGGDDKKEPKYSKTTTDYIDKWIDKKNASAKKPKYSKTTTDYINKWIDKNKKK